MKTCVLSVLLLVGSSAVFAADEAKSNTLTAQEISDGWILLFDGQTSYGWKTEIDSTVADGVMNPGAGKVMIAQTTTEFGDFELALQYKGKNLKGAQLVLAGQGYDLEPASQAGAWVQGRFKVESGEKDHRVTAGFGPVGGSPSEGATKTQNGRSRTSIGIRMPVDAKLSLRNVMLKPLSAKSVFNGKDLTGWKPVEADKYPSKFSVTDKGELSIKNGGGDIQTEGQWDDFLLQIDVFTNGTHLNSGIFFRAVPGEFWHGYEVQIRNQWNGDDRTNPVDFGTGGLYARQPTRKVISNDKEWFTMTLVAHGAHIATWVNGYQCSDYVDGAKDAPNARVGRYTSPGAISLQGHDPTTDLLFKNIRVAELPRR